MNPKFRALIWEQSRVTGVLMVWYLGTAALILLFFDVFFSAKENTETGAIVIQGSAIICALTSVLRQNVHGHLVADFEPRLARLPIHTFPLVTTVFFARAVYLLLLCAFLSAAYAVFYSVALPSTWMLLPIEIYAVTQALAWSRRSLTGIDYGIVVLLLVVPGILHAFGVIHQNFLEFFAANASALATPLPFAAIVLICYAVSLLGVHLERRDERYGLPTPGEIREWIVTRGPSPNQPFASPLHAQQWFERRARGWMIPVGMLGGVAILALSIAGATTARDEPRTGVLSLLGQWIPFIALAFAAVAAGSITLRRADAFCLVRPAETRLFASAKILAQGRAFALTLVAALVLSVLGFALFGASDLQILWQAFQNGHTTGLDVLTIIIGPFLLAALSAWLLMNVRFLSVAALPILALLLVLAYGASHEFLGVPESDEHVLPFLFWGITLYMLIAPPLVYARAVRKRAVAPAAWKIALPLWLAGGTLLWLYSALERPSFPLFLFHLGLMGMLLVPIPSIALRIARIRHV